MELSKKKEGQYILRGFGIISERNFSKDYDVIINAGGFDMIFFSKIAIPDITEQFKSYLLKEKSK